MKTRLLSVLSAVLSLPLLTVAGSTALVGCGGSGGGGGGGSGGTFTPNPDNLISDFEDTVAVVVQAGTPMRNGYWYTYNDTTCTQMPIPDPQATATGVPKVQFVPETPTVPQTLYGSGQALHAKWSGCTMWGGGVGADLAQPPQADGGTYTGPKVPYDASAFTGVRFMARAENSPMSNPNYRVKFPMVENTKVIDGGTCMATEVGSDKCSDDYGFAFPLPSNGNWHEVVVDFSKTSSFKQEGWGKMFPWNPAHMTSIQIQNAGGEFASNFDLWVDSIYFY